MAEGVGTGPTGQGEPECLGCPDPPAPRARGTEVLVGVLLLCAMAAAIGFAVTYVAGGQTQLEGALLASAFLLIAVSIGLWAKHFMPQGPYVQRRPKLESSPEQRRLVAATIDRGERTVLSRRVLTGLLVGAFGTLGAAALFPLRSLGNSVLEDLRRTAWRRGRRLVDEDGNPLRPEDLRINTLATVFPEGASEQDREDSQVVLVRVPSGVLAERPSDEGALEGVIAFSKVCTHAGCPVGQYQAETHLLVCPCHQSLFDVANRARPVAGPATRPLPELPLAVEEGYLVATDDFPEPVGPAFWSWGRGRR